MIPGHATTARLVTVLQLVRLPLQEPRAEQTDSFEHEVLRSRYYIQSQEDLYQTNEFTKFFSMFRVLWLALLVWQMVATAMCVFGQAVLAPVTWWEESKAQDAKRA